ncbi:MAG: flavodoxin family protein [Roseburia sp.]|nr:flavodoxin family protein [Anaeroplasma bactoclasticum]MCM1196136.1 flavodoxin family protein [Roseburia sp.]MCM1557133.1 flavodoxin family protein [Anaeroplasma bactoclasticum]
MKIPIIFSTITGNAFRLADAIKEEVPNRLGPYNIRYINDEVIKRFDTFVLVYWCNHGTTDDDTIALLSRMKNKKVVILGTLGASMETDHAKKVYENVSNLVKENNQLLGNFLCRGSIDLNRTAQRLSIPEGEKGHLSKERFERQKESLGYPRALDYEKAKEFVKEIFKEYLL